MFDPLRLSVALVPLAAYALVLGVLNLGRRTTVVSGGRDLAALAVGVSGLVLVGPIELLMPRTALTVYGMYAWPMVLIIYSLCVSLTSLLLKPRLVLYNACSLVQLRRTMAAVVKDLDVDARWAGSTVSMPRLHVELVIEGHRLLRTISLTATHDRQSIAGWQMLHAALAKRLPIPARRSSVWGMAFVLASLAAVAVIGWQMFGRPHEVAQSLGDLLRW